MKRFFKRTLALLLTVIMLVGVAPLGIIDLKPDASAKTIEDCSVGETITFGSYPQSKVTDSQLVSTLTNNNPVNSSWVSYGYYSGTGSWCDGNMAPSDYMKYKDVTYNGVKYRGVYFTSYRPYNTGFINTTYQDDNGYYTNTAYWFKYEPLTWRVLDPSEGFVMCNKAIDSQAYQNYVYCSESERDKIFYLNTYSDWATSSIREWLNDDFYNTAFTASEKSKIGTSYLENKSPLGSKFDSSDTYDKIFLLSFGDVLNSSNGFNSSHDAYDQARELKSTDYAQSQGCFDFSSCWHLRSPLYSYFSPVVGDDGYVYSFRYVNFTDIGVVPAFKFNPKTTITDPGNEVIIVGRSFDVGLDYYANNWNSSSYNANLANMFCALAAAVYNPSDIQNAYDSLGFEYNDYNIYDYDGYFDPSSCGYSLGFKKADGGNYTICLVSVRGSDNISDWVGNISLATFEDSKHIGFAYPANHIYNNIQSLISSKGITGEIKYFITGHSRGAAVANLLAVKLLENGISSSSLYNYNFACPDVACKYRFTEYSNIFNLCNREDPVPFVPGNIASVFTTPGTSWGKFGSTYWFTKDASETLSPFKDHDIWLYLDFFDQRKNPDEWETSFWDRVDDIDHKIKGWITKVLCPVDVIVKDNSGNNIASVINGEVNYYNSYFGDVIILTDGDKKVIYVNGERDFSVNLIGTATGKMTYSVEKYDIVTDEISEKKTFENVTLMKGKEMLSPVNEAISTNDIKLYVVDEKDGQKVLTKEINVDGSEKEIDATNYVKSVSLSDIKLNYKKSTTLNPQITADDGASYTVSYSSSNPKIASVDENGNVKANKKGTAQITVTVTDEHGNTVTDTCNVKVNYNFGQWLLIILLFGWIWY